MKWGTAEVGNHQGGPGSHREAIVFAFSIKVRGQKGSLRGFVRESAFAQLQERYSKDGAELRKRDSVVDLGVFSSSHNPFISNDLGLRSVSRIALARVVLLPATERQRRNQKNENGICNLGQSDRAGL